MKHFIDTYVYLYWRLAFHSEYSHAYSWTSSYKYLYNPLSMGAKEGSGRGGRLQFCSQKQWTLYSIVGLWERRHWSSTIFRECVFVFNTLGVCFRDLHSMQKKKSKRNRKWKSQQKEGQTKFQRPPTSIFFFRGGKKPTFFFFLMKRKPYFINWW